MRDAQAVRVMRGIDLRNVHRHRGLHRLVHLAHNGVDLPARWEPIWSTGRSSRAGTMELMQDYQAVKVHYQGAQVGQHCLGRTPMLCVQGD